MKKVLTVFLLCTVAATAYIISATGGAEPAPDLSEEAVLAAFSQEADAPAAERVLLEMVRWDDHTVALVRENTPSPECDTRNTLYIGAVDNRTGMLEGEPVTMAGDETWYYLSTGKDGVTITCTAFGNGENGRYFCSGGGLFYGDRGWKYLWPAEPGNAEYEAYWQDKYLGVYTKVPFCLMRPDVFPAQSSYWSMLVTYLESALIPEYGAEEQGIGVLGYEITDFPLVGTLAQGPGDPLSESYPYPVEVRVLDYRLLPADSVAAEQAGFKKLGDTGWEEPSPQGAGRPVFLLSTAETWDGEPGVLLQYITHEENPKSILEEARNTLSKDMRPAGDAEIPAVEGDDRYNPDTGLYFCSAGDFGLLIPEGVRDKVVFRTQEKEGVVEAELYARETYGNWLRNGGDADGLLCVYRAWRVDESDPRGEQSGNLPFSSCNDVFSPYSAEQATVNGIFYQYDSWESKRPDRLDLAQEYDAVLARLGEIQESFYINDGLPMDIDFTFYMKDKSGVGLRFGLGSRGELPLGSALKTVNRYDHVTAEGDYWSDVTYEGAKATYYVSGTTGEKTVTALETTRSDMSLFHRGIGVGVEQLDAFLCYSGEDYGPALTQPPGQTGDGDTAVFYTGHTRGGVPLPCDYVIEFEFSDGLISKISLRADLTR